MTAPTLPPPATERAPAAARRPSLAERGRSALRSAGTAVRRLGGSGGAAPPWLMGPIAALWAAVIGIALAAVPMLVLWMASPASGLTWVEALRVSTQIWVVGHGVPVLIAGTTYSLLPWGLVLIPLLLLGYAGGWATRRSGADTIRAVVTLVVTGAVTYGALAALVVTVSSGSVVVIPPPQGVAYAATVALVSLGWGAVRASGIASRHPLPSPIAVVLRSGLIGALTLVGIGALLVTASLMVHVDDAITMAQSLRAGVWGGLALLLLGVAYAPVLAVWGSAYAMGAGVVIGPAVVVSPFIPVTAPTQLPPFPLLAALPQTPGPLSWALPLAGVMAGVLAGVAVARRAREESRLARLALAAGAAVVAGLLLGLAASLASGSLGDLRLARIGPVPSTVGVLAAVLVLLGAVPSAIAPAPPGKPQLSVANVDETDATSHAQTPRED